MSEAAPLDPVLLDLLAEWEDRRAAGKQVSPEELCRDHPELADEFLRRIRELDRLTPLLDVSIGSASNPFPLLAGFELLEEIGRGGMGTVYRARDVHLDRVVAIKIPQAAGGSPIPRKRFEREAKILAQLRHPNIVSVHAAGWAGDVPYLVMEHVPGGNLAQHLAGLAGNHEGAAVLLEQVARGVDHAHRAGVVHRDLKPSNILIGADGHPQVGDFGVAALLAGEPLTAEADTPADRDGRHTRITRTGALVGTPAYCAPEAINGRVGDLTPAADVWSLGVILYEVITGRRPFSGQTEEELRTRITGENPPAPRTVKPTVPRELEAIALKCLAKDPGSRYATAGAVADALGRWQRRQALHRRLRRVASRAIVAVAVVIWFVAMVWTPGPEEQHAARGRAIAERVRRGETVALVPETGSPVSYRIRLGEAYTQAYLDHDRAFTVAAGRPALVEFLPDPGVDRYQLSAEIRQTGAKGDARGGLYFGHQFVPTAHGGAHVFGCLWFSDFFARVGESVEPSSPRLGRAALDYMCLHPRVATGRDWIYASGARYRFETPGPNPIPPGPWRSLTVIVTPETVTGALDGHDVGVRQFALLQAWANVLPEIHPQWEGLAVRLSSRGGVGLYVTEGEYSIRNCRIQPLRVP